MNYQKLPQQMRRITLVLLLLVGCGAPATPILPTATPVPPTPTITPSTLAPWAGGVFTGVFDMGDKAERAEITLKVSVDGKAITSVKLDFTNITCEGFTQGFTEASVTITKDSLNAPITNDKFEVKLASICEIIGEFTSSTAMQGTIRLLNSSGGMGSSTECGTWSWNATGK